MLSQCTADSQSLPQSGWQPDALLSIADPQQRLARIVERARHRPALHPEFRVEEFRVQGCLVRTWFVPKFREGKCYFDCDSDAVTLKALIGLLCDALSGLAPEEILSAPDDFLSSIGVLHQLAENRQKTIRRIAQQIRDFAQQQAKAAA